MSRHVLCLVVAITILFDLGHSQLYKFQRAVLETGNIFYKVRLTLGSCADEKIFMESKIWPNIKMNRIFDIYYKNDDGRTLVSKVEITLVLNSTDVNARSKRGVGYPDFSGFVILPIKSGFVLYTLNIYTCNSLKQFAKKNSTTDTDESPESLPFFGNLDNEKSSDENDDEDDN